jgi:hypothetical protein
MEILSNCLIYGYTKTYRYIIIIHPSQSVPIRPFSSPNLHITLQKQLVAHEHEDIQHIAIIEKHIGPLCTYQPKLPVPDQLVMQQPLHQ